MRTFTLLQFALAGVSAVNVEDYYGKYGAKEETALAEDVQEIVDAVDELVDNVTGGDATVGGYGASVEEEQEEEEQEEEDQDVDRRERIRSRRRRNNRKSSRRSRRYGRRNQRRQNRPQYKLPVLDIDYREEPQGPFYQVDTDLNCVDEVKVLNSLADSIVDLVKQAAVRGRYDGREILDDVVDTQDELLAYECAAERAAFAVNLEDVKVYMDSIVNPLKVVATNLMEQMVERRFELEEELKNQAWEYPTYGWDWNSNKSGSSWGQYQKAAMKEARYQFQLTADNLKAQFHEAVEEVKAEIVIGLGSFKESVADDLVDMVGNLISAQADQILPDAAEAMGLVYIAFNQVLDTESARWNPVVDEITQAIQAEYDQKLQALQEEVHSYNNHDLKTKTNHLNGDKDHCDAQVARLLASFEDRIVAARDLFELAHEEQLNVDLAEIAEDWLEEVDENAGDKLKDLVAQIDSFYANLARKLADWEHDFKHRIAIQRANLENKITQLFNLRRAKQVAKGEKRTYSEDDDFHQAFGYYKAEPVVDGNNDFGFAAVNNPFDEGFLNDLAY